MKFFSNQKGVELAISTLIIIAIALLVVVVLVGYFLGSFGRSGSALNSLSGEGEKGVSGINLVQSCQGGSQCSGITDENTCGQTSGCYWGFGQSASGGSSGGGSGTPICDSKHGVCGSSTDCRTSGGTSIGKQDCSLGQVCCT